MGRVLTIGVFDGVHRGHQALVAETVAQAAQWEAEAWAVTFDPNPIEVLRPDLAPARLCSVSRRVELLLELGLDGVEVLAFDEVLSQMPADEFARDVLIGRFGAVGVVVGSNFRFGHKAAGDVVVLEDAGLKVVEFSLLEGADAPISSSRIRAAVDDGEVELAAALLGHRHAVEGEVVRGHGRGRDLGYPTANLALSPRAAIPKDAVYAGEVFWPDGHRIAAISVGTNPTFGDGQRSVEAFLLDFDGELYGKQLRVEFGHLLRPMATFEGVEGLIRQMSADVARTRALMGG
ncbi:MAG: bifunctional riboflavin kinase/FAD synthetase [Candidatus Nanopelagicales bacterium]